MFRFAIPDAIWVAAFVLLCCATVRVSRGEESFDIPQQVETSPPTATVDPSQWGDLKLRFVYDGDPPVPKVIAKAFGPPLGLDESLLVNAKNRGIANVIIWLQPDPRAGRIPIHPSYARTAAKDAKIVIAGNSVVPRVTVLQTTQKLVITNADPQGHNPKVEFFANPAINFLLHMGESVRLPLPNAEPTPAKIEDALNVALTGYVHVRDNPYYGVANGNGELTIENVPKGLWTFVVLHERAGLIKQATLSGKEVTWKRGRVPLDIKTGENDLGDIELAPALFK